MLGNEKMYMTCLKIFSSISKFTNTSNYCQLSGYLHMYYSTTWFSDGVLRVDPAVGEEEHQRKPGLPGGRTHLARYTALPYRWSPPPCQVHSFTFQVVAPTLSGPQPDLPGDRIHQPGTQIYLPGGSNHLVSCTTLPSRWSQQPSQVHNLTFKVSGHLIFFSEILLRHYIELGSRSLVAVGLSGAVNATLIYFPNCQKSRFYLLN